MDRLNFLTTEMVIWYLIITQKTISIIILFGSFLSRFIQCNISNPTCYVIKFVEKKIMIERDITRSVIFLCNSWQNHIECGIESTFIQYPTRKYATRKWGWFYFVHHSKILLIPCDIILSVFITSICVLPCIKTKRNGLKIRYFGTILMRYYIGMCLFIKNIRAPSSADFLIQYRILKSVIVFYPVNI